ncbi:MAG: TSUP family transporter [Candidatus Lokiarchaeota archaeon]|nr:TSUP family transporter [Candidatus Lokiarchaeota archaeon]
MDLFTLLFILLCITGFISKYFDSTLGLGYGTILAPVLIIGGYSVYRVVPAILFSEFVSSAITALLHRLAGTISSDPESKDFKVSAILSTMGMIGAAVGVGIAVSFSELFITIYVAITVIITGSLVAQKFRWSFNYRKVTIIGFIASLNKSLSGGGYGAVVAGGQILSGRESRKAVASTATAEAVTTGTSYALYVLLERTELNLDLFLQLEIPLLIGAILSAPFAAYFVSAVKPDRLIPTVGTAAVLLGIYTIFDTLVQNPVAGVIAVVIFLVLIVVATRNGKDDKKDIVDTDKR